MSKFNCYILLTWGPRHGYKTTEHPAAQAQLRNIAAVIRGGFQQSRVVIAASDYTRKIHGPEDLPGLFHYLSTARLREAGTGLVMEDFNRIFRACTPGGKRFVLEALMEYGDLLTDLRTKMRLEQFGRSAISRLVREDMKPLNLARRPHPGSPESRRNQTARARDRSRAARKAHSDKLMRDLLALPPLRNRLGIDPQIPAQLRERSLRSLYCGSDGVRGCGAPVTNLSHSASFHSCERITPSSRGIEHLMCLIPAMNAPSPFPARTGDGVGYSAEHLVA
jgi:hypothetical protein